MRNWAGNVSYGCTDFARPASLPQLRAIVGHAGRVRALGTRHSFSDVAACPGVLVALDGLPPEIEIDTVASTARISAGLRYADVTAHLDKAGFALANLASLPHLSVAGACATATHGSGVRNQSLSAQVCGMELVTAEGDLLTAARDDPGFPGMVVGLGALGVVTALTLDLVPSFDLRQRVYEDLPLEVLDEHFDELVGGAYTVCLFLDWRGPNLTQVWIGERTDEPASRIQDRPWFTARAAAGQRHPARGFPPSACTQQLGVAGPWFERLPHFRPDAEPSSAGDELHSEYMVRRADAVAAVHALREVAGRIAPVAQISELRTVAPDDLWLSPFDEDSVSVHFTWIRDVEAVLPVVALVEERLAPFGARPHWGKVFALPPARLRELYGRTADFAKLVEAHDPGGKFGNSFLDRYLKGE